MRKLWLKEAMQVVQDQIIGKWFSLSNSGFHAPSRKPHCLSTFSSSTDFQVGYVNCISPLELLSVNVPILGFSRDTESLGYKRRFIMKNWFTPL